MFPGILVCWMVMKEIAMCLPFWNENNCKKPMWYRLLFGHLLKLFVFLGFSFSSKNCCFPLSRGTHLDNHGFGSSFYYKSDIIHCFLNTRSSGLILLALADCFGSPPQCPCNLIHQFSCEQLERLIALGTVSRKICRYFPIAKHVYKWQCELSCLKQDCWETQGNHVVFRNSDQGSHSVK